MEGRWLPGRCVLWGSAGGMLKKSWSIICRAIRTASSIAFFDAF
jgi:hypothetical protein